MYVLNLAIYLIGNTFFLLRQIMFFNKSFIWYLNYYLNSKQKETFFIIQPDNLLNGNLKLWIPGMTNQCLISFNDVIE